VLHLEVQEFLHNFIFQVHFTSAVEVPVLAYLVTDQGVVVDHAEDVVRFEEGKETDTPVYMVLSEVEFVGFEET